MDRIDESGTSPELFTAKIEIEAFYQGDYLIIARKYYKELRKHISAQKSSVDSIKLDQSTIEKLKGLGYLE